MTSPSGKNLTVGDQAPDFTLPTHNEGELNLAWYRGRKQVVLAFYPGDFTPVCSVQIPGYQQELARFEAANTQLFGISVDSVACHRAWAESLGGLSFPLMADYWPHGEVARRYGVLSEAGGYAERATFVIDLNGLIRHIEYTQLQEVPDSELLFEQLEQL